MRLGATREGMLYVEGRLGAILNGPDDHSLQPLTRSADGATAARERFGFDVDPAMSRSVGSTSQPNSGSTTARDGLAFLHALSLADVPWAKVGTEGKKRERIETVAFRSVRGRTVLMRAYDKGVESGTARPGEMIRLERQRRYRKAVEPACPEPRHTTSRRSSSAANCDRSSSVCRSRV